MSMKYNHTNLSKNRHSGGREWALQVADPGFKICKSCQKADLGAQAVAGGQHLLWN